MLTVLIILMALLVSSPVTGASTDAVSEAAPKVIILSYHKTDGRRHPQAWYDFQLEKDGRYMLINSTNRSPKEALRAEVPAYVADSLAQIVREEKMGKYKEHYTHPIRYWTEHHGHSMCGWTTRLRFPLPATWLGREETDCNG